MKFRLASYDIPMPPALVDYWRAWNDNDAVRRSTLVSNSVSLEVEWNDPRDSFSGRAELEQCMARLRDRKPDYRFVIRSEVDSHNGRLRYRWDMIRGSRVLMEGTDVVTLDGNGLICRVDGFFGEPTPLADVSSGVPADLRTSL